MKRSFVFLSFALVVFASAAEPVDEIDDSSYQSLYNAARQHETKGRIPNHGLGTGLTLSQPDEILTAIVKFKQLDLLDDDIAEFQEALEKDEESLSWALYYAKSFAAKIAEPLFRAGHIDEGVAFLKKVLPPQNESDGMLAIGYVSAALIEQKRFELAWSLTVGGPQEDRASRIYEYIFLYEYIFRTIAKTRKQPGIYGLPDLSPCAANEADVEIYTEEANRAFEYLLKLQDQAVSDDERRGITGSIPLALVALKRYDKAYDIVKDNAQAKWGILNSILIGLTVDGTQEEIDQWFRKWRELYDSREIDWFEAPTFIEYSIRVGQYLDALVEVEKFSGRDKSNRTTEGYFDAIIQLNVEMNFRYNSKELIERLINEYEKPVDDPKVRSTIWKGQRVRHVHRFHENIIKAQLNLDLVDDALETFRQFNSDFTAIESLVDIGFYAVKNKPPKEAERIEEEAIKRPRKFVDPCLVWYYAKMATRLMNDGENEKGSQYLKKAIDQAEETQQNMGIVCEELATHGYIDKTLEISRQFEDRYPMPALYLQVAEKLAADKPDKAKAALRKAFELFVQVKEFPPSSHDEDYHARMAALAVTLGEKELYYKIVEAALNVTEGNRRTNLLVIFTKQLALYGDKDHPLHAELEALAVRIPERNNIYIEGAYSRNGYPSLLMASAVNKAIMGDHVNARRLLKRAMEIEYAVVIRDPHHGMLIFEPAIIEARAYEK